MEVSGSYKVLYTKDGSKKRKIFHDGTLVIKRSVGSSCTTVLYDENIQELRKTTENNACKAYSVGDEFNFGAYMIQIEEVDGKTAITSTTAVEGIENRNMNSNAMSRPQVQRFKAPQSITPIAQVPLPPASQSHPMIQEEQTNQFMQSFSPIPTKPSSTLSFKTGSVTASILQANRSNRSGLSYRSLHNPNNNNTLPVTNNNNSIPLPPSSNYSYPTPVETTYPTFPLPVSMVKEEESSYCESSTTTTTTTNNNTNPSTTPFIKPILKTTLISNNKPNTKPFQPPLPSLSSSSTTNILSHHNNRKDIQLDNNLTKVMKEHQIIGANFILDCILRRPPPIIHDNDDDDDEEESEKRVRGCILADDMGLGKSLTTISVIWTLISLQITKVVIVCPSSLIDNWVQELKKWLGMKLIPLVIRSGSDANAIINTFAISRINKFPLLILSYEKVRKCVDLLNNVSLFHLLICDEGHRLKNIDGTKTIQALKDCKSTMRIVLTGTPIQNDLEELYALVDFVSPGILGSIANFKSMYAIYQQTKCDSDQQFDSSSSSASSELVYILSQVMLRRTQAEILSKLLPPRHDFILHCYFTLDQAIQYDTVISELQKNLQSEQKLDMFYNVQSDREDGEEERRDHNNDDEEEEEEKGNSENEDEDEDQLYDTEDEKDDKERRYKKNSIGNMKKKESLSKKKILKKNVEDSDESDEDDDDEMDRIGGKGKNQISSSNNAVVVGSRCVLPTLGTLRQLSVQANTSQSLLSSNSHRNPFAKLSSKLQFLDTFLSVLDAQSQQQTFSVPTNKISSKGTAGIAAINREKVVIVSGFRPVLDSIEQLLIQKQYGGAFYRLDGQVPIDQRQVMVNAFNNPTNTEKWIFLLSLKAGGVGINLIGANRLIMMDIDWNPAHDLQAMSRIWRQGQMKPVYIYRLISYGSIEESMLHRQSMKSSLGDIFEENNNNSNNNNGNSNYETQKKRNTNKKEHKFTTKELQELIYPRKMKAWDILKPPIVPPLPPRQQPTNDPDNNKKRRLNEEQEGCDDNEEALLLLQEEQDNETEESAEEVRQERILMLDTLLQTAIHRLGPKWLKNIEHGEEYFASSNSSNNTSTNNTDCSD